MGGCKDEHFIYRFGTWNEERSEQGMAEKWYGSLLETGPVSEKTREMIVTETDAERLSAWVKKAARSNSEEDFLSKI